MLIRVLEIAKSNGEFCFGGGNEQVWKEVDWFRDDPPPLGDTQTMDTEEGRAQIIGFIKQKNYYDSSKAYLVLHQNHSVTINYRAA